MAFPASTELLINSLSTAQANALKVQYLVQQVSDDSAAGAVNRDRLIDVIRGLNRAIVEWNRISAIPGMVQFARDQFDDQTLDIVTEFTAMVSAATALRDWITTAFPKDAGTGAWLVESYGNDGLAVPLQFSTAQLAQYRTNAATFTATIG